MKKILVLLMATIGIFGITGCNNKDEEVLDNPIVWATIEEGNIVINEEEITEVATFLSYDSDGVTIGIIAVRGTDGKVRVAFNTCQSCSPSPDSYFIQKGEYLECQNCGTKFHIDKIGIEKGGCNPAFVEEMKEDDGIITISVDYVNTYRDRFVDWNGPKA